MKHITQTYTIKAPLKKVWQALVDPEIIHEWSGGPVKMDEKEGTKFSLWGGDIHGINTKVVLYKLLTQDWYEGDWAKPSQVIFTLIYKNGVTTITLDHKNIPDDAAADIADGWKTYYLGPMKELLEQ
ncbi:SRPBCC domain-containing protein [Candidatus Berkelbacteria bacterium]|nr:SRPBCC domain-containing protein [Candidatus Berkelbacteria bacterium]